MYDLMKKLDTCVLRVLHVLEADFLLYLYLKYVPERAAIFITAYTVFFSYGSLYSALNAWSENNVGLVSIFRKSICPRKIFLCIFNMLRTTMGASSSHFKFFLKASTIQIRNLFFSFSSQHE